MPPWTCFIWNLISHIPSIPSLEASHPIDASPISMAFIRNTRNDPKYTYTKKYTKYTKNHINPKILLY